MKAGEKIYVSTYYQLLNEILGKQYKGWQSGIYIISKDSYIWMISLDATYRGGWINTLYPDGTIIEDYVDGEPYPKNIYIGLHHKTRFVFDRIKEKDEKRIERTLFLFRGVYKLSDESTDTHRILKKISDETDMF